MPPDSKAVAANGKAAGPRRRVLIDTDCGVDDAAAILLALASPEIELVGLTTVTGNAPLAATTRNSLRLLELAGRPEIPVAAGAERALVSLPGESGPSVHGDDGLGDVLGDEELTIGPVDQHAVDFMAAAAASPLTIVAIAPLTNLALLLAVHPEVVPQIERIVIMGGARLEGNVTPAAEFNIWCDPEAAARVFESGIPLSLVTLDVTETALLEKAELDQMAAGGKIGRALAAMIRRYGELHISEYGVDDAPLHDVLAVLSLIAPEFLQMIPAAVSVDHGDSPSRGATLVSTLPEPPGGQNALVATALDRAGMARALLEAVTRLEQSASR